MRSTELLLRSLEQVVESTPIINDEDWVMLARVNSRLAMQLRLAVAAQDLVGIQRLVKRFRLRLCCDPFAEL